MRPQQESRCGVHRRDIDCGTWRPGISPQERTCCAWRQPVAILPPHSVEARVKFLRTWRNGRDRHVVRQAGLQRSPQRPCVTPPLRKADARDLPSRVNAPIRSTCKNRSRMFTSNALESVLQLSLHSSGVWLNLRSGKVSAIIGDR